MILPIRSKWQLQEGSWVPKSGGQNLGLEHYFGQRLLQVDVGFKAYLWQTWIPSIFCVFMVPLRWPWWAPHVHSHVHSVVGLGHLGKTCGPSKEGRACFVWPGVFLNKWRKHLCNLELSLNQPSARAFGEARNGEGRTLGWKPSYLQLREEKRLIVLANSGVYWSLLSLLISKCPNAQLRSPPERLLWPLDLCKSHCCPGAGPTSPPRLWDTAVLKSTVPRTPSQAHTAILVKLKKKSQITNTELGH